MTASEKTPVCGRIMKWFILGVMYQVSPKNYPCLFSNDEKDGQFRIFKVK